MSKHTSFLNENSRVPWVYIMQDYEPVGVPGDAAEQWADAMKDC